MGHEYQSRVQKERRMVYSLDDVSKEDIIQHLLNSEISYLDDNLYFSNFEREDDHLIIAVTDENTAETIVWTVEIK